MWTNENLPSQLSLFMARWVLEKLLISTCDLFKKLQPVLDLFDVLSNNSWVIASNEWSETEVKSYRWSLKINLILETKVHLEALFFLMLALPFSLLSYSELISTIYFRFDTVSTIRKLV